MKKTWIKIQILTIIFSNDTNMKIKLSYTRLMQYFKIKIELRYLQRRWYSFCDKGFLKKSKKQNPRQLWYFSFGINSTYQCHFQILKVI